MKSKGVKYRKTMNTIARVGSLASKAALGAAIYTNPAIAGTVLASVALRKGLGYAEKYGDKYFQGKTGKTARLYRSGRDIVNAGVSYGMMDYAGVTKNTAKLVGDTGFLGKNAQRKYSAVNNNYIQPTLSVAQAAQDTNKAYGARGSSKQKVV